MAGFETCTCITMSCTNCETPFDEHNADQTLHFDSRAAAIAAIKEAGWWLLETGPVCESCAGTQACAEVGHAWEPWHGCGCNGHNRTHVVAMQVHRCISCDEYNERPATLE